MSRLVSKPSFRSLARSTDASRRRALHSNIRCCKEFLLLLNESCKLYQSTYQTNPFKAKNFNVVAVAKVAFVEYVN